VRLRRVLRRVFTAALIAASSKSFTTVVPVRPSRVALMLMECRFTSAEVVMPLFAKRVNACSDEVTDTEHSGVVENDRTFSDSFWACSFGQHVRWAPSRSRSLESGGSGTASSHGSLN